MKKVLLSLLAFVSIICSLPAHAQFNPSNGFQTISNQCGTFFLQGTTYYNAQGTSLGSTLPVCVPSVTVQNASALIYIPAKYTNATLPACSSATSGMVAIETDGAASPVYAATATGSGTLYVSVLCTYNGTTYNWTNH